MVTVDDPVRAAYAKRRQQGEALIRRLFALWGKAVPAPKQHAQEDGADVPEPTAP